VSTTVAGTEAIDFWPDYNGTTYGLVYRHATNNNLYFRTVTPATGAASSAVQVTTSSPTPHQHPNLHYIGGGYLTLYSTGNEVRCVRQNLSGYPLSNVALSDFPVGGAFLSSVFDGSDVVVVYTDATLGLLAKRIDPTDCSILGSTRLRAAGNFITIPTIAWNGVEFAIAYDEVVAGTPTVKVARLSSSLTPTDGGPVAEGDRPSIEWAGDRWVVRYRGLDNVAHVHSGSFHLHCSDGVQDLDESSPDCGGLDCRICFESFTYTDGAGDDVAANAVWNFLNGLSTNASDYIFFEILTHGIGSGSGGAWCASNAMAYRNAYVSMAPTSGSLYTNNGQPQNASTQWSRPEGGSWSGPDNGSYANYIGTNCDGEAYSWCSEWGLGGRFLATMPEQTGGNELYAWNWDGGYGWTFTLKVGVDRVSTCGF